MANYLIQTCDELISIVVNPGENEITTVNTYYINFTGETNPGCFTVVSESEEPIAEGISSVTGYTDCLECFQENNLGFLVVSCDFPDLGGPVNAIQFNEWPIGNYYNICQQNNEFTGFTNQNCLCFEVVGAGSNYAYNFDITGPFTDCDCQLPRNSGTESLICEICCDCGATGSTVNQITPPHPIWTDGYGSAVRQLNMIVLGGPNGLNN